MGFVAHATFAIATLTTSGPGQAASRSLIAQELKTQIQRRNASFPSGPKYQNHEHIRLSYSVYF
jgi:hypothetical protein